MSREELGYFLFGSELREDVSVVQDRQRVVGRMLRWWEVVCAWSCNHFVRRCLKLNVQENYFLSIEMKQDDK